MGKSALFRSARTRLRADRRRREREGAKSAKQDAKKKD
jgi:hypothetical protein